MFCTWLNSCSNGYLCCNFCKEKHCNLRCEDNCNTCPYLEDANGNLVNKGIKKIPRKSIKNKKDSSRIDKKTLVTPKLVLCNKALESTKYMVHIGSGNRRGKTYEYGNVEEALKKARILENRQKEHNKSIIIKIDTINNTEYQQYITY